MNKQDVENLLKVAYEKFLLDQPDFGNFTSATDQRELNIAHHYANYILATFKPVFPEVNLACDFDVYKGSFRKRPDIILHERGSFNHQVLVIEVKINGSATEKQSELDRIRTDWFLGLGYKYGAYINIDRGTTELLEVEVLVNN